MGKSTNLEQKLSEKNVVYNIYKTMYNGISDKFLQTSLFNGYTKTYTSNEDIEDNKQADIPDDQYTNVEYIIDEVLDNLHKSLTKYLTCTTTIDKTNASGKAVANLYINNKDFGVFSALELMTLETEFKRLFVIIERIPTLNTSKEWKLDEKGIRKLYASQPVISNRTVTEQTFITVVEPTEHQAAIVKELSKKNTVGYYKTTDFSGCIYEAQKEEIINKINDVLIGVKKARHEANKVFVEKSSVSDIIGYIFN